MVATYTAAPVSLTIVPTNMVGASFYAYSSISLATALTANDLVLMCPVPNGYAIMDAVIDTDAIDSGASPGLRLALGDSGNATRFITSANTAVAGPQHANVPGSIGYAYSIATTGGNPGYTVMQVKCTTAASTFVTGFLRVAVELQQISNLASAPFI